MKKIKRCWICGRTNQDLREEIDGLPKNSSLISEAGGIDGTSTYCCLPCKNILQNLSIERMRNYISPLIKEIKSFERDFYEFRGQMKSFQEQMNYIQSQTKEINDFFRTYFTKDKIKDEFRDVT
jgi:hypothetical protein